MLFGPKTIADRCHWQLAPVFIFHIFMGFMLNMNDLFSSFAYCHPDKCLKPSRTFLNDI